MTKAEREELIRKTQQEILRIMAKRNCIIAGIAYNENSNNVDEFDICEALDHARAALAVAEPVIREQADIALRAELAAVTERMSKLDFERTAVELERDALREENARLRAALKDLIEEDEYQTCSGEEDDGIARAAARAAIREGGKDE